jgi:hypothetical protein
LQLEERSVPSAVPPTANVLTYDPNNPHGFNCTCPICTAMRAAMTAQGTPGSSDYVFDNGSSTSTAGASTWAQPGGLGSLVTVTYSFASSVTSGLPGITYDQLREATQEAMAQWSKYAPIKFVEVADSGPDFTTGVNYSSTGDPMIRIGATHIDGPLGVLGYAYYPGAGLGGDVVLDNSENWGVAPNGSQRIDITEVIEHELGHSLGLAHELTNPAIMNPYYGGRFSGPGTAFLYQDDINGVRGLYGAGSGEVDPLGSSNGNGGGSGGATPVVPGTIPTFTLVNGVLTVTGTTGNDTFAILASATQDVIVVNGIQHSYKPGSLSKIILAGGGGTDSLSITGPTGAETVSLDTNQLLMTGAGLNLQATGFKSIVVNGNGTSDSATLTDKLGKSTVNLSTGQTTLTGNGLNWTLNGFNMVTVNAQHGGGDSVTFNGTPGNDTFTGRSGTATLQGSNYRLTANGFDTAEVRNGGAGRDVAYLYGSAGNDSLLSSNGLTTLKTSDGYTLQTYLFGPTYAFGDGGFDRADLYGSSTGTNIFTASPTFAGLTSSYGTVYAVGFSFVTAYGLGNHDIANLTGTFGNESIYDSPGFTSLMAGGIVIQARGFKTTNINGGGGNATIDLYDALTAGTFTQNGATSTLQRSDGSTTNVTNVAHGTVHGQGHDTANLLDTAGNNTFFVQAGGGTMMNAHGTWKLTGFEVVNLEGSLGTDIVTVLQHSTTPVHRSGHWG